MVTKSHNSGPTFGRNREMPLIKTIAGKTLVIEAADYLESVFLDGEIIWQVDGTTASGSKLTWTPNYPGDFRVLLTAGLAKRVLDVRVGLCPQDLINNRSRLDYFFCLISSKKSRLTALPLPTLEGGEPPLARLIAEESRKQHPAFAALTEQNVNVYRRHFHVLTVVRRMQLPSGLYSVFPGAMAYLGTNAVIAQVLAQLERLGLLPIGETIPTNTIENLLKQLDLGGIEFSSQDLFPDFGADGTPGKFIADALNALTSGSTDFAQALGTTLSGNGGLRSLFGFDARRGTVTTRIFGSSGGLTGHIESALGGLGPDGNVLDFSRGGSSLLPMKLTIRPGKDAGTDSSGGSSKSTTGWRRIVDSYGAVTVPYSGDPRDAGEYGAFVRKEGNNIELYGKEKGSSGEDGGTQSTGDQSGTSAGTGDHPVGGDNPDGGTQSSGYTSNDPIVQLDELERQMQQQLQDQQNQKDGGTGMPANVEDTGTLATTEKQMRWAIITRGGGLSKDPVELDTSTTAKHDPVIPGAGLRDPVRPDFFYEWTPTVDENRLAPTDPRVTDPAGPTPEGGSLSGGSGWMTFPQPGSAGSGVLGSPGPLSKTTTFFGSLMVETFAGFDGQGRRGDGIFGVVKVDHLP